MPLKNASKIGLSIACILCTPWMANAGIDEEWKIKSDELTRKYNRCMDEFRSAQFDHAKRNMWGLVEPLRPGGILSGEYKKWAVNGRKVYWVAHNMGMCKRGQVFTLDIESQEKCWDNRSYPINEKDRRYDCIRLFKIERDSITNIPYLYEYRKSKRFGIIRETQGVPINHDKLSRDALKGLDLERFNEVN